MSHAREYALLESSDDDVGIAATARQPAKKRAALEREKRASSNVGEHFTRILEGYKEHYKQRAFARQDFSSDDDDAGAATVRQRAKKRALDNKAARERTRKRALDEKAAREREKDQVIASSSDDGGSNEHEVIVVHGSDDDMDDSSSHDDGQDIASSSKGEGGSGEDDDMQITVTSDNFLALVKDASNGTARKQAELLQLLEAPLEVSGFSDDARTAYNDLKRHVQGIYVTNIPSQPASASDGDMYALGAAFAATHL